MREHLKTFDRRTYTGEIPAGTWVVFWREDDEAWVAHCLKETYKLRKRRFINITDPAPLPYFPISQFDACGWRAAHTDDPDYPVVVVDTHGTHFFPFPCANDPNGSMASPKGLVSRR